MPGDEMDRETKLNMYLCELCDAKATSLKKLREHYRQKHAQVEKTPQTPKSITAWLKKKHACPHCDYRSNLIGHVKRHILIHTGETPFECTHCDFKCRDKTTLRRHIGRHLENKPESIKSDFTEYKKYQCDNCNFNTSSKGAFSRHLLRHEDPKICQHCGTKFWKEESFENHILLHAGIASHPCESCDYKTNVASDLKNHVKRMHSKNKSWVCPECNYATSCPSDLSKHKVIHKSDRPYACDLCEYTCKRRSHLTVHQATHSRTLRNYSCPFCDYRTILIGTLKIHVRSHTGEKPYKCDVCGSAFTSRGGVQAHAYTHIKNWSQSCPHCDFTASKPHLFRKHMQIHKNNSRAVCPKTQNEPKLKPTQISKEKNKSSEPNARFERRVKSTPSFNTVGQEDKLYEKPPLPSPNSPQNDGLISDDCKADPDDLLVETTPEFRAPTLMEECEPLKIEDIDIFYPVKQECDTP